MQERRSGGWLGSGSFDRERHGLIFGRQRAGKSERCYACAGRQSCLAKKCRECSGNPISFLIR